MKKALVVASIGLGIFINAQTMTTDYQETQTEVMPVQEDIIYSTTSRPDDSGFLQTVGFSGAWKFDMNLDKHKIILTGGALINQSNSSSNEIRLMVYLADKPFNLNNPEFIGEVYSVIDISALNAGQKESGQVYETSWASEKDPQKGIYYPYILLGEKNPKTDQFEVRDVKVFEKTITIL
ncbi:MAG: hypothetical protein RBT46_05075 [Weeksellaceae bacterium]|nr:hypothetical protein [Weeksellaceae bacterium]MDX9705060.1 hypothetical protein [Weeksellaceae bacterium]